MALPSSPRYGLFIIWLALHSAEGARTVESLYGFFDRNQNASSHAGADGYRLSEPWVPDERAAWTLLNGNPRSLNLEMCGFAHWTREQWLSTGWVEGVWNPRQMIRHAAQWLREKCDRHGIPRRLLTAEQVANNERGIIDHFRYTVGKKDGNHTDVGKNFPWDVLMADVNGTESEDDMNIWDIVAFRPNRGQNLFDAVEQIQLNQAAHGAVLAAIANDKDITPEQLRKEINDAVAKHALKSADVVAQLRAEIMPLFEEMARKVQDADNLDEARMTVNEMFTRLGSLVSPQK